MNKGRYIIGMTVLSLSGFASAKDAKRTVANTPEQRASLICIGSNKQVVVSFGAKIANGAPSSPWIHGSMFTGELDATLQIADGRFGIVQGNSGVAMEKLPIAKPGATRFKSHVSYSAQNMYDTSVEADCVLLGD